MHHVFDVVGDLLDLVSMSVVLDVNLHDNQQSLRPKVHRPEVEHFIHTIDRHCGSNNLLRGCCINRFTDNQVVDIA